jgi:hypothetical protein
MGFVNERLNEELVSSLHEIRSVPSSHFNEAIRCKAQLLLYVPPALT